jgi:hypothetical protein
LTKAAVVECAATVVLIGMVTAVEVERLAVMMDLILIAGKAKDRPALRPTASLMSMEVIPRNLTILTGVELTARMVKIDLGYWEPPEVGVAIP